MKIESERKFLLASEAWRARVQRSEQIRDGLLSTAGGTKVRVRFIGARSTLTVKTERVGGVRMEYEYDIPRTGAESLMEHCGANLIHKRRHDVEEPPCRKINMLRARQGKPTDMFTRFPAPGCGHHAGPCRPRSDASWLR